MKKRFTLALMCCALMCSAALFGCATNTETAAEQEAKTQNRQYMATLNQQMTDLQAQMDTFNVAVAAEDLVGMDAQVTAVGKLIDTVKATEPSEQLADVKTAYTDGLDKAYDAMKGYVSLFQQADAGTLTGENFQTGLAEVQKNYFEAADKIEEADKALTDRSAA